VAVPYLPRPHCLSSSKQSRATLLGKGGGKRRMMGGEWIQVWYIWYIVRTPINTTMYPHPAQW
jgi:hypothetical protein